MDEFEEDMDEFEEDMDEFEEDMDEFEEDMDEANINLVKRARKEEGMETSKVEDMDEFECAFTSCVLSH